MQSILSIQSHVVFGYVGNKAATYPLQSMGFDVWPINTVQFSNHTGYGKWDGEIFSKDHILSLVDGIFKIGQVNKCVAVLTGYMGSKEICYAIKDIVLKLKNANKNIIYLCDPVIGGKNCYVKSEILDFFKNELMADIITPNQNEAEILSGILINSAQDLIKVADFFHKRMIKIVIITGIKFENDGDLYVFASDESFNYLIKTKEYKSSVSINGTGDLFSSTFLGAYINYRNTSIAMQYATYYLQSAINATILSEERELQVLSVKYDKIPESLLPEIICV